MSGYPYEKQAREVTTGDVLGVPGGPFEVFSVKPTPGPRGGILFGNERGTSVLEIPADGRVDVIGAVDVAF